MLLLGKSLIDQFKRVHPSSRKALDRWVKLIEDSVFKSPNDLKSLFGGNVDFVGTKAVFDVGGNKIRTITNVEYGKKVILVTHVLTHAEYDRNIWKE